MGEGRMYVVLEALGPAGNPMPEVAAGRPLFALVKRVAAGDVDEAVRAAHGAVDPSAPMPEYVAIAERNFVEMDAEVEVQLKLKAKGS